MHAISEIRCFGPWMTVRFPEEYLCLSWAIVNGGAVSSDTVAWRFLQIDELKPVTDVRTWYRGQLVAQGLDRAVGLLTSRRAHKYVESGVAESCHVVATVGLSNALTAGDPAPATPRCCGTINVLCALAEVLTPEAALEALALASEARTAALLEFQVPSIVSGLPASGTGTDCIVIAHAAGGAAGNEAAKYCGKHTALGHRIGWRVRDAVRRGVREWLEEQKA